MFAEEYVKVCKKNGKTKLFTDYELFEDYDGEVFDLAKKAIEESYELPEELFIEAEVDTGETRNFVIKTREWLNEDQIDFLEKYSLKLKGKKND